MTINCVVISTVLCAISCVPSSAQSSSPNADGPRVAVGATDNPNREVQAAKKLLERGLHFSDLYNWVEARPYLVKARQLFEQSGDKRNALYSELAAIRAGADSTSLAERSYKLSEALETNPLLKSDKELRMFCLVVKGELDGEVDSASMREDWTKAGALAQELGNKKWQYRALGQLGFADFYEGDLPGAQKRVAEALIGATTINDIGGEIFYLSTMASGLADQGMNDQALEYADRALALATNTPDAGYPIIAEETRLMAMANNGDTAAASRELREVFARAEVQRSHGQMAVLNATAARIAQLQHDLPGAIQDLNKALQEAKLVEARKVIPEYQSELSNLYRLDGDLPKAEALAQEAAASVQQFGFLPLVPKYLYVLAQIQSERNEYLEADRTYDRAAAIQDIMIGNANTELGKTALIKGLSDLYTKHFALIAEHIHDDGKAFSVLEQVRGRVMTDVLTSGGRTSPEALAVEKRIAQLRLKLMSAHSNGEVERIANAIFVTEQSRAITPEMSILKTKTRQTITIAQLQHGLSASEAVLEYVVAEPASYCLIITRRHHRVAKLAGKQAVASAAEMYLKEVTAKHAANAEARKLHELLLAEIPETRGKKQVVIVRDGPLHLVPFDALIDSRGNYLVESQSIVYAPSATSFFLLRTAPRSRSTDEALLAVGGVPYHRSGLKQSALTRGFNEAGLADLPNSEDEARAAIKALPNRLNTLLVGNEATETAFKNAVRHRMIHLAVHAIVNQTRPDRAALVLLSDPSNGEDGFLEAPEIVQLPLNADLVVLSACDTAVGPVEGEEGISTLSRAFLLAGARTVISTLWSIDDDSTVYLMKEFYAELAQKKPVPEALRRAKETMLSTFGPSKALPYYWGGFTVEGFAQPPAEH